VRQKDFRFDVDEEDDEEKISFADSSLVEIFNVSFVSAAFWSTFIVCSVVPVYENFDTSHSQSKLEDKNEK